ncbi:maleylpyruvate isomerase N-terminal domain-containing protein [Nocardia terrae]|uniref:maleylpyruvate isomerase N-terminal domain-containing protein n=1 Tax=Nocardia terrae TaxID=2675851 RepID=UPI0012FA25A7|nr:maleylpyruvate isomerase N-terminal domain-containing protein [Nocardia terrae]
MDVYELDRRALRSLATLVEELTDSELGLSTPRAGWTIRDLLEHMNTEHEAISELILDATAVLDADPRKAFGQAIARWIDAFAACPAEGSLRGPNGYADRIPVHPDTTATDRLVSALGRSPNWPAN